MKLIFFLGKGGVGKTTLSSLSALFTANKSINSAIVSLDAAHNLADVFDIKLHDDLKNIHQFLLASEPDLEKRAQKYILETRQQLNKQYSYLSSYGLLDYFDILEHAPDTESTAILITLNELFSKTQNIEFLFCDMPPTALSLQFMTLVKRNILWIEKLIALREKILRKKEIISTIQWGKIQIESDKINYTLEKLKNTYLQVHEQIIEASFFIIENPDKLSVLESERIINYLKNYGVSRIYRISNKSHVNKTSAVLNFTFYAVENIFEEIDVIVEKNPHFFDFLENKIIKNA
jgi:arsenite-transporting ATPase